MQFKKKTVTAADILQQGEKKKQSASLKTTTHADYYMQKQRNLFSLSREGKEWFSFFSLSPGLEVLAAFFSAAVKKKCKLIVWNIHMKPWKYVINGKK